MDRGFTLMEILIAVTIFGVLMMTLFTSFQSFISSSTMMNQAITEDERVRTLFSQMERDMEALYITRPPRYKKPDSISDPDPFRFHGIQESVSGVVVSRLGFASLNHISFGEKNIPGVARIIYYARSNEDNREDNKMDLCRFDTLRPFDRAKEGSCDPVLVRNIAGFDLSYFNEDGEEQLSWDSEENATGYRVPVSVKFKITLKTGNTPTTIETQIPLFVNRRALD